MEPGEIQQIAAMLDARQGYGDSATYSDPFIEFWVHCKALRKPATPRER